jgi:hypothetical protein
MTTEEMMFNFINRNSIQQKNSFEDVSFVIQLFYVHVYLKAFFLAGTKDKLRTCFSRFQGVHSFKHASQIPFFLKQLFLKECNETNSLFECVTSSNRHFERVMNHIPEVFDSIEEIQILKDLISELVERKQKASEQWVCVASKNHIKKLKLKLNKSYFFDSWDKCHNEFKNQFTHTGEYDYYFDYIGQVPDTTTSVISLMEMIRLLNSVPKEELDVSIQFLNHFGEFNTKNIFGIGTFKFNLSDIQYAFPGEKSPCEQFLDDDYDNDYAQGPSYDYMQGPYSYEFIKDVMTTQGIHYFQYN